MHWLQRDELGLYLNDAGLTGAGVEVGAGSAGFAQVLLRQGQGRQPCSTPRPGPAERTDHPSSETPSPA
jgi:hypothetical protein